MLIDSSYFNGKINIPNVDKPAVSNQVNALIAEHETNLLTQLLGVQLYEAFKTGLTAQVPEQKWVDLRDGIVFTYGSVQYKWEGFLRKETIGESTVKLSLIANYVWYWWSREHATTTTGTGEQTNDKANASPASFATKQARAWNEISRSAAVLYKFLLANTSIYMEWEKQAIDFGTINDMGI